GEQYETWVEGGIEESSAAILLITYGYLKSDWHRDNEVPNLLGRGSRMPLIPILVEDYPWQQVNWLAGLQMFPRDLVPYSKLDPKRRRAVVDEIVERLRAWLAPQSKAQPQAIPMSAACRRIMERAAAYSRLVSPWGHPGVTSLLFAFLDVSPVPAE